LRSIFIILLFTIGAIFAPRLVHAQTSSIPVDDEDKVMKVYPNPAVTYVNFEFQRDYDKENTIVIFNFIGKKVYELPNMPAKLTLNVSDYYRGTYIYQIRDRNGRIVETGKFMVVK
jgi:hypothetical protein